MTDDNAEKKKAIIEAIKNIDMPEEAKAVGIAQAATGASADSIINSIMVTSNGIATKRAEEEAKIHQSFAGYTPTERQIAKMLIENTGVDMLDSGGAYGRHWQRNRKIADFRKMPEITLDLYPEEERVTVHRPKVIITEKQKILKPAVSIQLAKKAPELKIPKDYYIEEETKYIDELAEETNKTKERKRLRS